MSNLVRAKDVMHQLLRTGEIDWPERQEPGRFGFTVNRPGRMNRASVDFDQGRASVQQIEINSWGVMNVLHTFSGARTNNPDARRDWFLTTVWVIAMDALAIGDSGEAERRFRREAERYSGRKPNSDRSEATLAS